MAEALGCRKAKPISQTTGFGDRVDLRGSEQDPHRAFSKSW
jgi:hypothetical protein